MMSSWLNKHFVPRHSSAVVLATWGSGKTLEDGWLRKPHCLGRALNTSLGVIVTPQLTTTQKVSKAGGLYLGSQELKYQDHL